jgi:hypothetical protein
MSNVIKVPRSSGVFDPNRLLCKNPLIAAQVRHFEEVESHLPPELRTGIDPTSLKTEGEASEYIRRVTRAIHHGGGRAPQKVETAR